RLAEQQRGAGDEGRPNNGTDIKRIDDRYDWPVMHDSALYSAGDAVGETKDAKGRKELIASTGPPVVAVSLKALVWLKQIDTPCGNASPAQSCAGWSLAACRLRTSLYAPTAPAAMRNGSPTAASGPGAPLVLGGPQPRPGELGFR